MPLLGRSTACGSDLLLLFIPRRFCVSECSVGAVCRERSRSPASRRLEERRSEAARSADPTADPMYAPAVLLALVVTLLAVLAAESRSMDRLKALAVVGAGRLGLTGCVLTVRWSLRCVVAAGAVWVRRLTAAPTTKTTGDRQLFVPCL